MDKKKKKKRLDSIKKLKEHYTDYLADEIPDDYQDENDGPCPLCVVVNHDCDKCLWLLFRSGKCTKHNYDLDPTWQRLGRLDRWEKAIRDK